MQNADGSRIRGGVEASGSRSGPVEDTYIVVLWCRNDLGAALKDRNIGRMGYPKVWLIVSPIITRHPLIEAWDNNPSRRPDSSCFLVVQPGLPREPTPGWARRMPQKEFPAKLVHTCGTCWTLSVNSSMSEDIRLEDWSTI